MKKYIVYRALVCGLFSLAVSAQDLTQVHLDRIFQDLHSSDPSIRNSANGRIIAAFKSDLPDIERYSGTLCESLSDPDGYIRQQASGIMSVLSQLYPEHSSVLTNCSKGLVTAALDPVTRVSGNAISVLANIPGGPPPGAEHAFSTILADPGSNYHAAAAIGLLRLSRTSDPNGMHQVSEALRRAPDAAAKITILNAISQAGVPASSLSGAVSTFLYDRDPDVQISAVRALAAAEPDPDKAITYLQNIQSSSSVSEAVKHNAIATAERLASQGKN